MATGRASSRAKILKAATEVAKQVGPGNLSLDAVAQRAGVSKGGLLYNFPSKEKLLKAVVQNHVDEFNEQQRAAETKLGDAGNAVALAFLELFRREEERGETPPTGVLAAIAEDMSLIDAAKDSQHELVDRLWKTSRDRELSLIAVLAVEGLRWMRLCEFGPLDEERKSGVLLRLEHLLGQGE